MPRGRGASIAAGGCVARARGRLRAWPLIIVSGIALPLEAAGVDIDCRFAGGIESRYRLTVDRAGVQRVDVEPRRWGRVDAGTRAYRFVFDGGLERYRIVVVIDRSTGAARRVYGREPAMARPFAGPLVAAERLVRESGQCGLPDSDRIAD